MNRRKAVSEQSASGIAQACGALFLCAFAVVANGCAGAESEPVSGSPVETYMVGDIEVRTDGNLESDDPYRIDEVTLALEPGEGKEYKYRLEEGRTMVYSWVATGPVRIEMHSEADGAPDGTAEFFDVVPSGAAGHGTFLAPFPGIHGWYWENQSEDTPVTVTIRSAGFYTYGVEFPGGQTHQLEDVVEAAVIDADCPCGSRLLKKPSLLRQPVPGPRADSRGVFLLPSFFGAAFQT